MFLSLGLVSCQSSYCVYPAFPGGLLLASLCPNAQMEGVSTFSITLAYILRTRDAATLSHTVYASDLSSMVTEISSIYRSRGNGVVGILLVSRWCAWLMASTYTNPSLKQVSTVSAWRINIVCSH